MAVCLEGVLVVEESFDKDVRSSFIVHHLDLLGVPDNKAHFELLSGLLFDIPNGLFVFRSNLGLVDFNPALDDSLRDSRRGMVDLAELNWFVC